LAFLWVLTGAAVCMAFVAWRQARRTAKRLEQISQMYWELKYQHGELRVQLQRAAGELPAPQPPASPDAPAGGAFIPLASLKR
jgi:hypothetical protein